MVGAEEGLEPAFLSGGRHCQELVVGGSLLRLGEDAQSHGRTLTEFGGKAVKLPVTGVFELDGGRIKAWRDYFDMQMFFGSQQE